MIKVTIIDDRIENEKLAFPAVTERVCFLTEEEKGQEKPGHGTRIAQILLQYAKTPVCITNLQILYDADIPVNLDRLTEALKWCSDHETPNIIMISAASTDLYEEQELHEAIRRNHARGTVIIAAGDNRQYRAVPACYPEVIGVCCDKKKRLNPGTYAVVKDDPIGIDVIANCDTEEDEEEPLCRQNRGTYINAETKETPSNSYAVPVAAAAVCGLLKKEKREKEEILQKLDKMSDRYIDPIDYVFPKDSEDEQIRVRFVTGKDLTEDTCITLARECHDRYGYDTLIIGTGDKETPPYVIDRNQLDRWRMDLSAFLQRHFQTEMVWLLGKQSVEEERSKFGNENVGYNKKDVFAADMTITETNTGIRIVCEDGETECKLSVLLEMMMCFFGNQIGLVTL